MPIRKVDGGFKWGNHGKVYPDRAGAERQAAAAHANGWTGDVANDEMTRGAGVILRAPGGECLFLQRSGDGDHPHTWCWPGGGPEPGEDADETALRELDEETHYAADASLSQLDSRDGFITFVMDVPEMFEPQLNEEHSDFIWSDPAHPPEPLHPGVRATLEERELPAMDARPHAADLMALDRDSVRETDKDGRMHVSVSHISKANVCPYFGREIPHWRELRLDPEKIYQLLRDPKEMAKPQTVKSFDNLPLLSKHVPVTAATYDGHQPELVVGSLGTDAEFDGTYMNNSLVVWAKQAVEDIELEKKAELSSAYYYRADMTPGTFKGVRYDGVMRDIRGNHVAIVSDGRAGDDIVVMDGALKQLTTAATDSKETKMPKTVLTRKAALVQGAITAFLSPLLAMDAKIDYAPILKGLGPKNYKARKPGIITAIQKATAGKLAQDADIEGFHKLLDSLDDAQPAEPVEDEEKDLLKAGEPVDHAEDEEDADMGEDDDDPCAKVMALLDDKVPADVLGQIRSILKPPSAAQDSEDNVEPDAAGAASPAEDEEEDEMVSKTAMDAALKGAVDRVRREQRELRAAEAFVRPWVGELVAMDSAEQVYRSALKTLGVKADGIHRTALKTIIELQPKPGEHNPTRREPKIAMDAARSASYAERFPGASSIRTL